MPGRRVWSGKQSAGIVETKKNGGPRRAAVPVKGSMRLEGELRPEAHCAVVGLTSIRNVHEFRGSNILQVNEKQPNIIVVAQVLHFCAEDELPAVEVHKAGRNCLFQGNVIVQLSRRSEERRVG